jgi:hypothetical protein
VEFPGGYTHLDRRRDENRLAQLYGKRLSRKKVTAEEDAEEAHLAARVLNPAASEPERLIKVYHWRPTKEETLTRMKGLET